MIKALSINVSRILRGVKKTIWWLFYVLTYKKLGYRSYIYCPLQISGAKNISIENKVYVGYKSWLTAVPITGSKTCELVIGEGSTLGNFNHIYSTQSIVFDKHVLTADNVYITDNLHNYENVEMPIKMQGIKQISTVHIGEGTWIGENACIIGAKVGKNCVVGANAVVTKDIPDYCVVIGAPARIIKRYNLKSTVWEKVEIN